MNPYEEACKEFLKGCSNAVPEPESCLECLTAFLNAIKRIASQEQQNRPEIDPNLISASPSRPSSALRNLSKTVARPFALIPTPSETV